MVLSCAVLSYNAKSNFGQLEWISCHLDRYTKNIVHCLYGIPPNGQEQRIYKIFNSAVTPLSSYEDFPLVHLCWCNITFQSSKCSANVRVEWVPVLNAYRKRDRTLSGETLHRVGNGAQVDSLWNAGITWHPVDTSIYYWTGTSLLFISLLWPICKFSSVR